MTHTIPVRWLLVPISAVSAIALGFFLVPADQALKAVQHTGYYAILAAALSFAVVALKEARRLGRRAWTPADTRLIAIAGAMALLWQVNGLHGFKVLMDELVLNATAMSMHFDREVFVPLKAHDLEGDYFVFGGVLDKRPLFFPLLLSVLHDVSGYRPSNAFVLNGVLSGVLLFLVGRAGRVLGGSEGAGLVSLLLLASAPLIGLNATGGGFDLLNVTMISLLLLLAVHYLRRPERDSQDLLVLGAVLLAQTRYESALFIAATGLILLIGWWQARGAIFSWGLVAAPLFLLTIPLQSKLLEVNPGYWTSEMKEEPFALKFFFGNLGHAVNFLFTVDGIQSGSPLLSAIGIVCTLFGLLYVVRRWKQSLYSPEQTSFFIVAIVVLGNFVLVLFYFWGQLDDFVATRLVLPLLVLFALSSAFVLGRWFKQKPFWLYGTAAVSALLIWSTGISFSAKAASTRGFHAYQEVREEMAFIASHPGNNLFVMPGSLPGIVQRRPAMTINMLNERAKELDYHLRLGTFDNVFVFQRMAYDASQDAFKPAENSHLGPEFVLETLSETPVQPLFRHRISRLVKVDLSRAEPRPPDWKPKFPSFELPVPDGETPVGAYVRRYLQNLP